MKGRSRKCKEIPRDPPLTAPARWLKPLLPHVGDFLIHPTTIRLTLILSVLFASIIIIESELP